MDRLTTIKAAVSAAAAALTAFWGWTGWLAAAWFLAMLLDYATGSAAALRAGTWSSRCAREGLWHKAGSVAGVLVAALLDFALRALLGSVPGLGAHYDVLLCPLVTAWYLLTELGSVVENAGALGAALSRLLSPIRARIDGADGSITQLSLDAGTLQTRLTSAEGNVAALEQTVSDQGARIALVTDADGVNAAAIVAAINDGDSSIALSADKIDLNGITTVADTLHIGSQNSLERKYLIFHKSGAVISATRGDLPELMLSAGKIDLCGELYHNGKPLDL